MAAATAASVSSTEKYTSHWGDISGSACREGPMAAAAATAVPPIWIIA
jgi:hypothetical protein